MKSKILFTTICVLLTGLVYGQKSPVFQTESGAIQGYDPVSYFKKGEAIKGMEEYSTKWKSAIWYFSSEENKKTFESDPNKYAPQYGGYCSYAVAKGYTAKVDPTSWKIIDGKLYLSYNQSIKKNWENYQEKYIEDANVNWPEVLQAN